MKRVAIALAITAALAAPAAANALTIGQAGRDAAAWDASHCGKAWDWICSNAYDPWPIGSYTGTNKAGTVQWWENGGWDEDYIVPFQTRHCWAVLGIGPNGGTPLNISVSCN